jgi:hypothetical protein
MTQRPEKVRLTEALERLVQLYDAWGKPEQARQWRKKLEEEKIKTGMGAMPAQRGDATQPKQEKKDLPQSAQKTQSKK